MRWNMNWFAGTCNWWCCENIWKSFTWSVKECLLKCYQYIATIKHFHCLKNNIVISLKLILNLSANLREILTSDNNPMNKIVLNLENWNVVLWHCQTLIYLLHKWHSDEHKFEYGHIFLPKTWSPILLQWEIQYLLCVE